MFCRLIFLVSCHFKSVQTLKCSRCMCFFQWLCMSVESLYFTENLFTWSDHRERQLYLPLLLQTDEVKYQSERWSLAYCDYLLNISCNALVWPWNTQLESWNWSSTLSKMSVIWAVQWLNGPFCDVTAH